MNFFTLKWDGGTDGVLVLTDQRKLPVQYELLECNDIETVFDSIKTLAVRGAPAIGVSAAYGVCVHMKNFAGGDVGEAMTHLKKGADYLASSRPTAVNLFWALNRMKKCAEEFAAANPETSVEELKQKLLQEAKAIDEEDKRMCLSIGENGKQLITDGCSVLTHCNAGALATAGIGTALAPMYAANNDGINFKVYADETRPLLQGSRITAWELNQAGIDVTVICDNMAGCLMKDKKIDLVIVGADRIAANGDVANKIGTYSLSVLAKAHGVPFYVAAPSSTFDFTLENGNQIPIEERDSEEVKNFGNRPTAPEQVKAFNPAFDVTPAENITGIITEKCLIENDSFGDLEKII